jgi:TonB family protein
VLPRPPQSALDTIRGTVRVSVRLQVANDGSVSEVASEIAGPSRYFERQSLQAARQWQFAPAEAGPARSVVVRFAFTRGGVTAVVTSP